MVSLSAAVVFSTSFEAMLYGLSVFLFILTLWVLLRNRKTRRVNWAMVSASSALLILSTMEMVVNIVRLFEGFVKEGPLLPGGPEEYFGDVSRVSFVLKTTLYNVQTLILDGVVIYRTYKVWNNFWIIVIPVFGWLGLLGCSGGLSYSLATTPSISEDIFEAATSRWLTGNWGMTLITNVCATLALAFRIWQVTSKSAQYRQGGRLSPILRVIVESGALYSLTVTAALVLFLLQSNGVYVVLDMISPVICIVFNMIIVRIGLAADGSLLPEPNKPVPPPTRSPSSASHASASRGGGGGGGSAVVRQMMLRRQQQRAADVEMKDVDISVAVEIAQFVSEPEPDANWDARGDLGVRSHSYSRFSLESASDSESFAEDAKSDRIGSPVEIGPSIDAALGLGLGAGMETGMGMGTGLEREREREREESRSALQRAVSPNGSSQVHVVVL
ncbi:hypothetical protein C8Q79DRAFT_915631 [Trametes meyenii]|nr:hypothetical protein C8Q79DRAFT_915631 [Trametes meyenii]